MHDKYVHEFALLCKRNEYHGYLAPSIRVRRISIHISRYIMQCNTTFVNVQSIACENYSIHT